MNAQAIECRAQRRARGRTVAQPSRPAIASRPLVSDGSYEAVENARRRSEFYRRLHGQVEPRIEIWRF